MSLDDASVLLLKKRNYVAWAPAQKGTLRTLWDGVRRMPRCIVFALLLVTLPVPASTPELFELSATESEVFRHLLVLREAFAEHRHLRESLVQEPSILPPVRFVQKIICRQV